MGRLCFNDVLLCEPRMIDPSMSTGLWWCQSPEDVQAVGVNAVCLSVTRRWEDVKNCGDWLSQFPFVFVASPDRELVEQVEERVLIKDKHPILGVPFIRGIFNRMVRI